MGYVKQEWKDDDFTKPVSAARLGHMDDGISTLDGEVVRKSNNLSDLVSAEQARSHLGLGSAATASATSFDATGEAVAQISAALGAHISGTGAPVKGYSMLSAGGTEATWGFGPYYMPEWFGAAGKVGTDDSEAFEKCCEALSAVSGGGSGGTMILSPQKTYETEFNWRKHVNIESGGQTMFAAKIKAVAGSSKEQVIGLAANQNQIIGCRIKGIQFIPNGNLGQHCIRLKAETGAASGGCWYCEFVDIEIKGFSGHQMWFQGAASGASNPHQFISLRNVQLYKPNTGAVTEGSDGKLYGPKTSQCLVVTGQVEKITTDNRCLLNGIETGKANRTGTLIKITREFLFATTLEATAVAGATKITVKSATGFENNKVFTIGDGPTNEICEVQSSVGKEITLKKALEYEHSSTDTNLYQLSGTAASPNTNVPVFMEFQTGTFQNAELIALVEGNVVNFIGSDWENLARGLRARSFSLGGQRINLRGIRVNSASVGGENNGTGIGTVGSTTITSASGTWVNGDHISGPGVPAGATVTVEGTTLTLSSPLEANGTTGPATLNFTRGGTGEGYIARYEGICTGECSYYSEGPIDKEVIVSSEASVRQMQLGRRGALQYTRSSGITLSKGAAAVLQVQGARDVMITSSGTIRMIESLLGTGEEIRIRAGVGVKATFEQNTTTGTNLWVPGGSLTISEGETVTFLSQDKEAGYKFVLVGTQRNFNASGHWDVMVIPGAKLYYQGNNNVGTSKELGNERLRLSPVYISPCKVTAMYLELTVAGEAASIGTPVIYADNGNYYPGKLIAKAKSISLGSGNAGEVATGGTAGFYEGAVSPSATLTGGLYWIGVLITGAPTTQPTLRTGMFRTSPVGSTALPSSNRTNYTWDQTGITVSPEEFTVGRTEGAAVPARVGFRAE